MNPSLCLLPVDVNVFVLIDTVQTISTTHLHFCQRVENRQTIIYSQCASSSSEPLDTLFVPIRIIMLEILHGFISSTIRNSWAVVAPPKAITVVIQDILRFWRTSITQYQMRYPKRRLLHVIAGLQVDRLKQARGSTSGAPVNLFFTWLFFCMSNTRDTFFIGISLIFLSGALDVFTSNMTLSVSVFFVISRESSTLPVLFILP